VAGKDVQMFSGAQRVIEIIRTDSVWQEVQLAEASRTQSVLKASCFLGYIQ